MRKRGKMGLAAIDIPYVLGGLKKSGAELPVKVTVDITDKLGSTLLKFGGLFAGAIVVVAVVKHIAK